MTIYLKNYIKSDIHKLSFDPTLLWFYLSYSGRIFLEEIVIQTINYNPLEVLEYISFYNL